MRRRGEKKTEMLMGKMGKDGNRVKGGKKERRRKKKRGEDTAQENGAEGR